MKAEDFVRWLEGVLEARGEELLTETQLQLIEDKLSTVIPRKKHNPWNDGNDVLVRC